MLASTFIPASYLVKTCSLTPPPPKSIGTSATSPCHLFGALLRHACLLAIFTTFASASSFANAESFVPTWKLLKNDEKRQFVAGYIYGWKDAEKAKDIAKDIVRQNPREGSSGLEKIKADYDLSRLKVDTAVRELDIYFGDPSNRDASFSQAITSIRSR